MTKQDLPCHSIGHSASLCQFCQSKLSIFTPYLEMAFAGRQALDEIIRESFLTCGNGGRYITRITNVHKKSWSVSIDTELSISPLHYLFF
ncbi:MAG: hypothetical protein ABSC11_10065 [Smithella sp.]